MGFKEKRCEMCGGYYTPTGRNQRYCANCKEKYKQNYNKEYWVDNKKEDEELIYGTKVYVDYATSDIYISEMEVRRTPTDSDYQNIKNLLEDFGINSSVPIFNTYLELNTWKNNKISAALS